MSMVCITEGNVVIETSCPTPVSESGKNDGVVYSEMRDFEHDGQCIVQRTLKEYE